MTEIMIKNESVVPLSVLRNYNITEGKTIKISINKYSVAKNYVQMGFHFLFEGIKCLLK